MKIVIAPDSFKGSLSAYEAAQAMREGICSVMPDAQIFCIPMADGGDGTVDVLKKSIVQSEFPCPAHDPFGNEITTHLLLLNEKHTVWIEAAQACGLALIPEELRNPQAASSYGVGEMIAAALTLDCTEIILSLGGSGTNDGGMGMLKALGARFYRQDGTMMDDFEINFDEIFSIDWSALAGKLNGKKIHVLCDVDNPLLGKNGATYVFAPQKGAKSEDLPLLEKGMHHYAALLEKATHKEAISLPGAGAAGGLGFALYILSDAKFISGAEYIIELLDVEEKIRNCDLVFTGEGSFDGQSLGGKVPVSIAHMAKKHGKPTIVLAGATRDNTDAAFAEGISAVFSIQRYAANLTEAMQESYQNLAVTAANVARVLNIKVER